MTFQMAPCRGDFLVDFRGVNSPWLCGSRCRSASSNPPALAPAGLFLTAKPRQDRHQSAPLSLGTKSVQTWLTVWTGLGLTRKGRTPNLRFRQERQCITWHSGEYYEEMLKDKERVANQEPVQLLAGIGSHIQMLIVIHNTYIYSTDIFSMYCVQKENAELSI